MKKHIALILSILFTTQVLAIDETKMAKELELNKYQIEALQKMKDVRKDKIRENKEELIKLLDLTPKQIQKLKNYKISSVGKKSKIKKLNIPPEEEEKMKRLNLKKIKKEQN